MTDPTTALRAAARQLHDAVAEPAGAPAVPAALRAIEDALTTLSRTCYAAAHSFVPLADGDESIAQRYSRAAATWPSPRGGAGPSHEQQARVLSSLHDAGAALRAAAGHCARAADNLAATMEPLDVHAARAARSDVVLERWTTSRT
jgi:hypothetical protein